MTLVSWVVFYFGFGELRVDQRNQRQVVDGCQDWFFFVVLFQCDGVG